MKPTSLDELFIHELKDLYDAEHQLVEALPKLAKAATDPDLKAAFEKHLAETRTHVNRLREVFRECDEPPERETCDGMKGLVKEGQKAIEEIDDAAVLDAGLIAAAQKVEHYEIASYGTLITWARLAGLDSAQQLLEETLEEEKAADEKLTEIAESSVNATAKQEDEEEDTEEEVETSSTRASSRGTKATPAQSGAPARSRRATK
jgi:ferritin-like metal-binding protein YciE